MGNATVQPVACNTRRNLPPPSRLVCVRYVSCHPLQEHASAVRNLGLSGAALAALQADTADTHARLVTQLIAAGKFNWQGFPDEAKDDQTALGISKSNCVDFMRRHCNASMQARPLLMSAGSPGKGTGPCWGPSISNYNTARALHCPVF